MCRRIQEADQMHQRANEKLPRTRTNPPTPTPRSRSEPQDASTMLSRSAKQLQESFNTPARAFAEPSCAAMNHHVTARSPGEARKKRSRSLQGACEKHSASYKKLQASSRSFRTHHRSFRESPKKLREAPRRQEARHDGTHRCFNAS